MSLGAAGERHIRQHLMRQGFQFIEANWRCGAGELDLIFRQGAELVFVEVKTRRGQAAGSALESVSAAKGRKLLSAAEQYLAAHPELGEPIWRIDIAALQLDSAGRVVALDVVENAVLADTS